MVQLPNGSLQPLRPLRRSEYDKLVMLGVFDGEKLELIRGFLVPMSPIGPPHSSVVDRLNILFVKAIVPRAMVRIQNPYAVHDHSEPEPDLALVPDRDYSSDHPTEAFLVIEVADSSLEFDRTTKASLYAASHVTEYWVVNLLEGVVEVHHDPDGHGNWRTKKTIGRGGTVSPLAFPDVIISVDEILPRS